MMPFSQQYSDVIDLVDLLCLELANKKDWSAHGKAERVKAFLVNNLSFNDIETDDGEENDG
jgi:hypothetical protein